MTYHALVSQSRTRLPYPTTVEAEDEALAAFLAANWQKDTTPNVYPVRGADDRWIVTDGFDIVKVQILSREIA